MPYKLFIFLAAAFGLFQLSTEANAVVKSRVNTHNFQEPDYVKRQVWFWESIFGKYGDDQMVIHDQNYPELIIDLIDFKVFRRKYGKKKAYTRNEKNNIADRYVERYEKAIKRFRSKGTSAAKLGPMEKRIYSVYSRNKYALADLMRGRAEIRSQSGLSDEFSRAAKNAHKYLPYMERIFAQNNLPTDLTRLAFVESMFNTKAHSKVGASGIWQFMPATARRYMTVNHYIDERHEPLKATEGAARYLMDNYRKLGEWPLAITAYNHGAGGMSRAVRQVGTKNIQSIIQKYRSSSFGFASRNFYSEFLAARNIYNRYYLHKRQSSRNPLRISRIKLPKRVSIYQLINFTPLSTSLIKRHNPALKKKAFSSYRYKLLPANFSIVVPDHLESKVRSAVRKIRNPRKKMRT